MPVRTANRVITRKTERGRETLPLCEACGERRKSWVEGRLSHSSYKKQTVNEQRSICKINSICRCRASKRLCLTATRKGRPSVGRNLDSPKRRALQNPRASSRNEESSQSFMLRSGSYRCDQPALRDLLTTESFRSQQKPTYAGSSLQKARVIKRTGKEPNTVLHKEDSRITTV